MWKIFLPMFTLFFSGFILATGAVRYLCESCGVPPRENLMWVIIVSSFILALAFTPLFAALRKSKRERQYD